MKLFAAIAIATTATALAIRVIRFRQLGDVGGGVGEGVAGKVERASLRAMAVSPSTVQNRI
jgi:hypothetical protein